MKHHLEAVPWISLPSRRSLTYSEASARSGPEKQKDEHLGAFRTLKDHTSVLGKNTGNRINRVPII